MQETQNSQNDLEKEQSWRTHAPDNFKQYHTTALIKTGQCADTEDRPVVAKESGEGTVGVWDQQIQPTERINNKGPAVQHREPYSISCDKA